MKTMSMSRSASKPVLLEPAPLSIPLALLIVGTALVLRPSDRAYADGYVVDGYSFSQIDPFESHNSFASGINNLGQVVGAYTDAQGGTHGFLRDAAGKNQSLKDFPGAIQTYATGIDDSGKITVATLQIAVPPGSGNSADGNRICYTLTPGLDGTYSQGTYSSPITVFGAARTDVLGISSDGKNIVGEYFTDPPDRNGNYTKPAIAFADIGGVPKSIIVANAAEIGAFGVNIAGTAVGYYNLPEFVNHAFMWQNGPFFSLPFDIPGIPVPAQALGINNKNQIVGYSLTDKTVFFYSGGSFTEITMRPAPGPAPASPPLYMQPFAINDNGQIVGHFQDSTGFHGFLLTPAVLGIDVSGNDGNEPLGLSANDWAKVYNDRKAFAFVKATEGKDFTDPTFLNNMTTLSASGVTGLPAPLLVGLLHFGRPDLRTKNGSATPEGAIAEANYFLGVVKPYLAIARLPPALDLEVTIPPNGIVPPNISAWTRAWLQQVQCSTGLRPILYLNGSYISEMQSDLGNYPLWATVVGKAQTHVDPFTTPPTLGPWNTRVPTWTFKQYAVDGTEQIENGQRISDFDSFNGTLADLQALLQSPQPLPPPTFSGYVLPLPYDYALAGTPVSIEAVKILAKSSEPSCSVIASVNTPSAQGGIVRLSPDQSIVTYTPPPLGNLFLPFFSDSFQLTIMNANGERAPGTIDVILTSLNGGGSGNGGNLAGIASVAGGLLLTFYGIPGLSYDVQTSADLKTWTKIASVVAGQNGEILGSAVATGAQAFFRTIQSP